MKRLLFVIGALGFLFLGACQKNGSSRGSYSDLQSCVDFGGGCNPDIFNQFRSNVVRYYPTDSSTGRLRGASEAYNGGYVYYSSLDHCGQDVIVSYSSYVQANTRRWIPAILPMDGGLVCINSDALYDFEFVASKNNGDPAFYNNSAFSGGYIWSELSMYNYIYSFQYNGQNNNPKMARVKTHFINVKPSSTSGNSNTSSNYYNQIPSFDQHRAYQQSVSLPQLCDRRVDSGSSNHRDCGNSGTCEPISNQYYNAGNLGICMNP